MRGGNHVPTSMFANFEDVHEMIPTSAQPTPMMISQGHLSADFYTIWNNCLVGISWEAVGKGDFKYSSIGLKVKFFYRRIFRQWISIFLSHDFVFSTLTSSSSNPTLYAIAQFMIFSILCTIQYRIHWMLTLILPLSVKRSKRF